MQTYFDDFAVGQIQEFGSYEVTREAVLDFATKFDPQPFHLDDAAAAANPLFGRVSASGWHTASMTMRMIVDHWREIGAVVLGGKGVDEMRWLRPVYPGDTLRVKIEIIDLHRSISRPDRGTATQRVEAFNQHGETVMRFMTTGLFRTRPG